MFCRSQPNFASREQKKVPTHFLKILKKTFFFGIYFIFWILFFFLDFIFFLVDFIF